MSPVTNEKWQNWAGNQQAAAARVATPRSAEEVAEQVRSAARDGLTVRMTGTGHSFTGAALAEGVLLRPTELTAVRSVDTATGLVTVEAGLPLHRLNRVCWTSTVSRWPTWATSRSRPSPAPSRPAPTAPDATSPDSPPRSPRWNWCSPTAASSPARARSAPTCSTRPAPGWARSASSPPITWQTVPAFLLRAQEEPMKWDEVLARLDEFEAANEHFEFYWFPHTEGCLTKRNNRVEGPAEPLSKFRYWLDDLFLSNTVFEGINKVTHRAPAVSPFVITASPPRRSAPAPTPTPRTRSSPARARSGSRSRSTRSRGSSSSPPCASCAPCSTKKDWKISFPIEVRLLPQEDAWLSMAYGRHSAFIAVHVYHRDPHEDYFRGVEELMTSLDGRPHWGKLHTRDAAYLEKAYPRFADFQALRDELDPDRRFANAYTRQVFGD